MRTTAAALSAALLVMSPSVHAQEQPGVGPDPKLPKPESSLVPTVNIAPATSWLHGGQPTVASGLEVAAFATGLDHPRWIYPLPNGDVLVAETNAPPKPAETGIKAWFTKLVMRRATGAEQSPNRIRLLRDADGDGVAEINTNRAAILEVELDSGKSRLFASGLRNPNGLAWEPTTDVLWTVVNERDEIGNDLVPDYLTSVKDGAFYGWPYSYWGQNVDERVKEQRPDLVAKAIKPDYGLGAHVAALGLAFYDGTLLPAQYRGGAFIGLHGSWNREPRSGYKVIYVPFSGGKPSGQPIDILTGFVNADGEAQGRPVGVATDKSGALLVADDVGNTIWRITPAGGGTPPTPSQ
jgi:glucose/arabinose dehydrogenase